MARLAQSVERKALNLVVVGSSPTVGALLVGLSGGIGANTAHAISLTERARLGVEAFVGSF